MKQENKRKFILIYYFNKYKDYPVASRDSFRNYFNHKHEGYKDLDLLIRLIEEYQIKFYGQTIQGYMDHTNERRGMNR